MLTRFSVQGYRNFKKKVIWDLQDIRDYRFNTDALLNERDAVGIKCALIYGRNAVGKTNFGNAIFDIWANLGLSNPVADEHNYLNADADSIANFEYEFYFSNAKILYSYSKFARNKLATEKLTLDDEVVFSYNYLSSDMEESNLSVIGAATLNWEFTSQNVSILSYVCNNTPLDSLGPVGQMYRFVTNMGLISDLRTLDRDFVSGILDYVIQHNKVKDLEKFLNHFGIKEKLGVYSTVSGERVLCFVHETPIPFARNCSSGTVSLLRLYNYFIKRPEPSLLFVDEFDAFYHHDLAEKVIGYFKSKKHQIVCASHNTDLFSNKIMRPDCLFILSSEGLTSAANATKRELREGHNLEKLYKAGEFDV